MKIIFLDFDGVLNSNAYTPDDAAAEGNLDKSRFPLLKELVDKTGAEIVLSTTWRKNWDRDESRCNEKGLAINRTFAEFGLSIFDKTPELEYTRRAEEIELWLDKHKDCVEAFVILDDEFWGWGKLQDKLVRTSPRIGKGLEAHHIEKAIGILIG